MARTHGKTSTYTNGECRCSLCRKAWAAYKRDYRRRRRNEQIVERRITSGLGK